MLLENRLNYDAWFDLTNLEQSTGDKERVGSTYKAAVENIPPANEERFWRRYVFLWVNWAVYEEMEAKDNIQAKKVYENALSIVPHKLFTFPNL